MLRVCSDWRRLAQRSQRQDIRSGASYVIDLGSIFGFLQLVLIWKQRQKLRKLSVIDHSRSIAVEVMGQSLLSCVLAIVCLYVRFLILNIENRRLGRIRRNTDNYFIMLITVFRYLKIECIEKAFVFNSTHRLNQDLWMKKFFGERTFKYSNYLDTISVGGYLLKEEFRRRLDNLLAVIWQNKSQILTSTRITPYLCYQCRILGSILDLLYLISGI